MEETLLFSVIVPVYNGEAYLEPCVESLLAQTFGRFELLLVDDGSTDGSPAICDAFAGRDPRVRVIHKPNGGHTSARNAGLEGSRGEYVVFLDSDDWLEPDTLAVCAGAIGQYHPSVAAFGWLEERSGVTTASRPFGEGFYDRSRLEEEIFPRLMMSADGGFFPRALWGKAVERELLRTYQLGIPPQIKTGEDMCCVIQVLFHAQSLFLSPRNLYHYRVLEGSVSRRGDDQAVRRCLRLVHYLAEALPETETILREQFLRLVVQQMYSACVRLCASKPKWSRLREEFSALRQDPICKEALSGARFSSGGKALRIKQRILRAGALPTALAAACRRG